MKLIEKLGFTPGPWLIDRRDEYEGDNTIEQIGSINPGFIYADDAWLEITKPDALLIAAAPEMLEALIKWCLQVEKDFDCKFPFVEQVHSIIEKATGMKWEKVKGLAK